MKKIILVILSVFLFTGCFYIPMNKTFVWHFPKGEKYNANKWANDTKECNDLSKEAYGEDFKLSNQERERKNFYYKNCLHQKGYYQTIAYE